MPQVATALDLFNILSESGINLRQPVALEKQLLRVQRMDSEVGRSMLQLLQVRLGYMLRLRQVHLPYMS